MTERTCPLTPEQQVDRDTVRKRRAEQSRARMASRGIPSLREQAARQEAKQQHPTRKPQENK